MAVPRKKLSRSRRGKRRLGHKNPSALWAEDKQSGELHRPHHMIPATGEWRGRVILAPKEKVKPEQTSK